MKVFFKSKSRVKSFSDNQELREVMTKRSALTRRYKGSSSDRRKETPYGYLIFRKNILSMAKFFHI